jgi:hypothetical protein
MIIGGMNSLVLFCCLMRWGRRLQVGRVEGMGLTVQIYRVLIASLERCGSRKACGMVRSVLITCCLLERAW